MAAVNSQPASVTNIDTLFKQNRILPLYFIYGDDLFEIQKTIKLIESKVRPLIDSEFDIEVISADKKDTISNLLDLASAFPFGSNKKLIIAKNFEYYSKPSELAAYANDPAEHSVLVISNFGNIPPAKLKSEPYKSLISNGFIFKASEPRGAALVNWIKVTASQYKLKIDDENAQLLVDIVGPDRNLLEMQLIKFFDFLGEGESIDVTTIEKLASTTKEFTIFNLLDAVGAGDKSKSLLILNSLIDQGEGLVKILPMLTKYISVIAQSFELRSENVGSLQAARKVGVAKFFYDNAIRSKFFINNQRVIQAGKSLLEADIRLKTTATQEKTIAGMLISELLKK